MIGAVDVETSDHGSLVLFHLLTFAATDWVAEHVGDNALWFARDILACEPRYADALAQGMASDGLCVE